MKAPAGLPVYPLISSQQMVQYMWKYCMNLQATQVPCAIQFDEQLDFKLLAQAVNIEIQRNDSLRLRVFKQKGKIRQYFLDSFKLDKILVKEFSSHEEQEEYFNRIGETALDIWHGEMFRIIFFRSYNGKSGIFVSASHVIMDGAASFIFFNDLMNVYDSLKNGTPMPKPMSKYEDCIKKELGDEGFLQRAAKANDTLSEWVSKNGSPVFCHLNGAKWLERERKLTFRKKLKIPAAYFPVLDKTCFVKMTLTPEDSKLISDYIEKNQYSPEWVLQLGCRIYLSKINRCDNDMLFWVLCPRRKTVKEKHCGGTLASPVPWRETLSPSQTFDGAVRQLAATQSFLYRHSDVPFTMIRSSELKLFHISPLKSANSMMFSFFPLDEKTFGGRVYEYLGYSMGHYVMPLYTLTMKDAASGCYKFTYIHRLLFSSDEDVYAFHNGVVRALLAGVKSPNKTLEKISEEI